MPRGGLADISNGGSVGNNNKGDQLVALRDGQKRGLCL